MSNSFFSPVYRVLVLPALIILLLVSFLIFVPGYFGVKYVNLKEKELNDVEHKYRQLYSQVNFLLEQYDIYEKYGDLFYDLEKRGLVSSEKRPVWLDNILLFGYSMQFRNLRASFKPQVPVKGKKLSGKRLDPNLFKINPVTLRANLPVDVDFFRLVNFINNKISRYSYFDKCSFSSPFVKTKQQQRELVAENRRSVSLFSAQGLPIALDINCSLNIITSHPRERKL